MSFRLFIYYCAVCGGWAALLAWGLTEAFQFQQTPSPWVRTSSIAAVVGLALAAAVGTLDALLNAVGLQRWTRVLVCAGVGLAGGLLGGTLGQLLLENLGLPRFLGWMIVGMGIGSSVAVFDVARALSTGQALKAAQKKLVNGLLGGAGGGALGGLLFDLLGKVQRLPHSSLAFGLVILGLSIGLLTGLAQVILKEAWVTVEQGFRAGREMILSKAETLIGRAESSDIGLFGDTGVGRTHARILWQDNRYVLADAGGPGGTFLNDQAITQPTPLRSGDTIRVGNSRLRFGERQRRPKRSP
jgi:FHA domain-containing protein